MKVRLTGLYIFFFIYISFISLHVNAEEIFKGEGTKQNPYVIETKDDLYALAEQVNNGNTYENVWFRQMADIDMEDSTWIPIGICNSGNYFYGIYDGAGHSIMNLNVLEEDYAGLFGTLGGVIVNLGIESGKVNAPLAGGFCCYAAKNSATIANCYSKANVMGETAGGIAADFYGRIYNCWTDSIVTGDTVGGIAAYKPLEMSNCFSREVPIADMYEGVRGGTQVSFDELYSTEVCDLLNEELYTRNIKDEISYQDYMFWELKEGQLIFSSQKGEYTDWLKQNRMKRIMIGFLIVIWLYFIYQLVNNKKQTVKV